MSSPKAHPTTKAELAFDRLKRDVNSAMLACANRAAASARTRLVSLAAREMGLKQDLVRRRVTIRKATINQAQPALLLNKNPLNAILLGAKALQGRLRGGRRGRGRGVAVRKLPGSPFPHAFIAPRRWGLEVVERVGRPQYPLRGVVGKSVAEVGQKFTLEAAVRFQQQMVKMMRQILRASSR